MDKLNLGQHISRQYNEELEDIRTLVMNMGGLVERQLSDALQALTNLDESLAELIITSD